MDLPLLLLLLLLLLLPLPPPPPLLVVVAVAAARSTTTSPGLVSVSVTPGGFDQHCELSRRTTHDSCRLYACRHIDIHCKTRPRDTTSLVSALLSAALRSVPSLQPFQ